MKFFSRRAEKVKPQPVRQPGPSQQYSAQMVNCHPNLHVKIVFKDIKLLRARLHVKFHPSISPGKPDGTQRIDAFSTRDT
jgi:hypothetical protein